MAADDENGLKPPRRKVDIDSWASNDIKPGLPSPGQPMQQKKGKRL